MENKPKNFKGPVFEKFFSVAEYCNLSPREKLRYDRRQKYIWDNKNVNNYAIRQGRAEGVLDGEHKNSLKIAHKLKNNGMSLEEIMEITELSQEEVVQLFTSAPK